MTDVILSILAGFCTVAVAGIVWGFLRAALGDYRQWRKRREAQ